VALSPDGQQAVSASWDGTLKVWDLETGCELRTFAGHSSPVTCVAVCPDGRGAVSASGDCTFKVWDLETGAELRNLAGHLTLILRVAVSPDGRRPVSASADSTLKVWDSAQSAHRVSVSTEAMLAASLQHCSGICIRVAQACRFLTHNQVHNQSYLSTYLPCKSPERGC
jgi:WD40 repeat protein